MIRRESRGYEAAHFVVHGVCSFRGREKSLLKFHQRRVRFSDDTSDNARVFASENTETVVRGATRKIIIGLGDP